MKILERPNLLTKIHNESEIPDNTMLLYGFPSLDKGIYHLPSTPIYF